MSRIRNILVVLLFAPAALFAQLWPLPAKTPNTDVSCNPCLGTDRTDLVTVGYSSPITTFTGRFLDSLQVGNAQQPFRTARAFVVIPAPERNRIYMMIGSAVVAYDMNTFFTRLAGGEPLVSATTIPVNPPVGSGRPAPYEQFLQWDKFFYAENGSGWKTLILDGQQKLFDFDYDDQGYVYVGYASFGWGIVKDDGGTGGGLMQSVYQDFNTKSGWVASVKTGNRYYAIVSGDTSDIVFDVTDRTKPQRLGTVPPMSHPAKSTAGDRFAIVSGGQVKIYSPDDLVAGRPALLTFNPPAGFTFAGIAGDGTNFFADAWSPTGISIVVFRSDGHGSYTQSTYPTSINISPNGVFNSGFRYGGGFLTVSGYSGSGGGWDLQLIKIDANLVPSVVDLKNYIRSYYIAPPDSHHIAPPIYINIYDGTVWKVGSKYYLIIEAYGLGDVYEIKGADTVTTSFLGCGQTASCNGGPFYGDQLRFQADATAPSVTVQWDFGNPEAASGADLNNPPALPSGIPGVIGHRYSGITPDAYKDPNHPGQQVPSITRQVTATNVNDATMRSSVPVQLKLPQARFGLLTTKGVLLFKQPDASSPAPIVAGDNFVDISDGEVAGHWAAWTRYNHVYTPGATDGQLNQTIPGTTPFINSPSGTEPVGGCGTHSMVFDAHYGPYTSDSSGLKTIGNDFDLTIAPFNYIVRPFAAAVSAPSADSTNTNNVLFSSTSRVSADKTSLTDTTLTYQWDLVTTDQNGDHVVLDGTGHPVSSTPTQADGSNPSSSTAFPYSWSIPKNTIAAGSRVRLTLSSPFGAGVCSGLNSSVAYSAALNPLPSDLKITGGCTNGSPPCSFSVSSLTAPDGWTYSWSATTLAGTGTTPAPSSSPTYSPTFSASGTYRIAVTVSNSVSSIGLVLIPDLQVSVSNCGPMVAYGNVDFNYQTSPGSNTVSFAASAFNYTFCSDATFTWNFGDGHTGSGQNVNYTYSSAAAYPVTLTIVAGTQSVTITHTVTLQGSGSQQPTGCGTMVAYGNVDFTYQTTPGSNTVSFAASAFNYTFCSNATFTWNFGDGHTGSGQNLSYTYSGAASYQVTLTIGAGSQSVTIAHTVTVQGSGSQQPTGCGPMVAYGNVDFTYQTMPGSNTVSFAASAFNYTFCSNATFTWNFGDGHTGSGQNVSYTYNSAASYSVTLTIAAGSQSVTITHTVTPQGSGSQQSSCPTMVAGANVDFTYRNNSGSCTDKGGPCVTGDPINFTASDGFGYSFSCNPNHSFSWDFGDRATGSGLTASHSYTNAGTYDVQLTINNGTQSVTIHHAAVIGQKSGVSPGVTFTFTITPTDVQNEYKFTASSNPPGAITTWNWDFGDGPCQANCTGSPVTHKYAGNANYQITLSVPGTTTTVTKSLFVRRRAGHH